LKDEDLKNRAKKRWSKSGCKKGGGGGVVNEENGKRKKKWELL